MEFSSIASTPPAQKSEKTIPAQKTPWDAHKEISYMPGLGYGTSGLVTGCVAFYEIKFHECN
jgi:hypothetical protein